MAACPSCGKEVPGEFPFCPFCAAPLTVQPAAVVQEERKVVSVLFCDLVGFTAASERADPENEAANLYADAAERWLDFGNKPECAFALLGQGRCLTALGNHADAEAPLREARELFASMGYQPALTETQALLHRLQHAAS